MTYLWSSGMLMSPSQSIPTSKARLAAGWPWALACQSTLQGNRSWTPGAALSLKLWVPMTWHKWSFGPNSLRCQGEHLVPGQQVHHSVGEQCKAKLWQENQSNQHPLLFFDGSSWEGKSQDWALSHCRDEWWLHKYASRWRQQECVGRDETPRSQWASG